MSPFPVSSGGAEEEQREEEPDHVTVATPPTDHTVVPMGAKILGTMGGAGIIKCGLL